MNNSTGQKPKKPRIHPRPRALNVKKGFDLWECNGLAAIDSVNLPYITAREARKAAAWLIRFADWKETRQILPKPVQPAQEAKNDQG